MLEKRKPERRDRTAAPRPAATPPAMRHRTATHLFRAEKMQLRRSKCITYDDVAFTLPIVAFTLSGDPCRFPPPPFAKIRPIRGDSRSEAAPQMPVGIRSGQSGQPMILDGAEDVVLETTRAAEEPILGFRHRQSRPHLQFDEAQRGDEIGHLQENVLPRRRTLRILDGDVGALLEECKQELRQLLLTAIIVDANTLKSPKVKPNPTPRIRRCTNSASSFPFPPLE